MNLPEIWDTDLFPLAPVTRPRDIPADHSVDVWVSPFAFLHPQSYNDWKNYALSGSTYDPSEDEEASPDAIANFSSELGPDPRLVQNLDPRILHRATELLQPLLLSSSPAEPSEHEKTAEPTEPASARSVLSSTLEKFRPVVEMGISEAADAAHDVFRVEFQPRAVDSMTVDDAKRIVRGLLRATDRAAAQLAKQLAANPPSLAERLEKRAKRAAERVDYEALLPRKEAALQAAKIAVEDAQRKIVEARSVVEDAQRRAGQVKREAGEAGEAERAKAEEALKTAETALRSATKRLEHAVLMHRQTERSLERLKKEVSGDKIAFSRVLSAAIQASDVSDWAVKTAESVAQNGSATRAEITAANREAARATERTASLSLRAAKLAAKLVESESSAIQEVSERNAQEVSKRMEREGELHRLRQRRSEAKRLSDDLAKWAAVKKASADAFAAKCKGGNEETEKESSEAVETVEIEDLAGSFDVDNLRLV